MLFQLYATVPFSLLISFVNKYLTCYRKALQKLLIFHFKGDLKIINTFLTKLT